MFLWCSAGKESISSNTLKLYTSEYKERTCFSWVFGGRSVLFNWPNYCANQRLIFTFSRVISSVALAAVCSREEETMTRVGTGSFRVVRANWIGQLPPPAGKSIGPQAWETSVQFRWAAAAEPWKLPRIIGSEDFLPSQRLCTCAPPCEAVSASDKNEVVWVSRLLFNTGPWIVMKKLSV